MSHNTKEGNNKLQLLQLLIHQVLTGFDIYDRLNFRQKAMYPDEVELRLIHCYWNQWTSGPLSILCFGVAHVAVNFSHSDPQFSTEQHRDL